MQKKNDKKRKKERKIPPRTGKAAKFLDSESGESHRALCLSLATRGDLSLTELRVAIYFAVLGKFSKSMPMSSARLAKELSANSTHISTAAKQLERLRIVSRNRSKQPFGYQLVARDAVVSKKTKAKKPKRRTW